MKMTAPLCAAVLWLTAGSGHAQNAGDTLMSQPVQPVICLGSAPFGLDPAGQPANPASKLITRQIFETLVRTARDGVSLEPGLARSWEVSPDGLEYTFELREGVEFQSSPNFEPTRILEPDDVIFTFNRLIDPDHFLRPTVRPRGAGSFDIAEVIAKVARAGDRSVRFTLKAPNSSFPHMLAMDFAGIQSAEYAGRLLAARQGWMLDTHPIGTGAFGVDEIAGSSAGVISLPRRKPDFEKVEGADGPIVRALASIPALVETSIRKGLSRIQLSAHSTHWQGAPKSPGLVFRTEPDPAERFGLLEAGECHIMPAPLDADVPALNRNPETSVIETDGMTTLYLAFNADQTPFSDKWVRRALAEAIDIEALTATAELNAVPARGIVSSVGKDLPAERWTTDLDLAENHLAEAGAAEPRIRLLVPVAEPDGRSPLGTAVADAWGKLGAEVSLRKVEWENLRSAIAARDYDAALLAWQAESPDFALTYEPLLTCDAKSETNASHWCDTEFDEALGVARDATEPSVRQQALFRAARKVANDLPILSLLRLKTRWAIRSAVTGLIGEDLPDAVLADVAIDLPDSPASAHPSPEQSEIIDLGAD